MIVRGSTCSRSSVREMPNGEPTLRIGLAPACEAPRFFLCGRYDAGGTSLGPGWCVARARNGEVVVEWQETTVHARSPLILTPLLPSCSFTIADVPVGEGFHWAHREDLTWAGALELLHDGSGALVPVNHIGLEAYLESVVSSEMNPAAPPAFLEAHAVVARSWTLAQLARRESTPHPPLGVDIWQWWDRKGHELFDFCADDHCQRYHGLTRRTPEVVSAVQRTRGLVLMADSLVVDARFSKCCGGFTEEFATAWGDETPPGLVSVRDAPGGGRGGVRDEGSAADWIRRPPPAYCGCDAAEILDVVLLPMDRATLAFFRWREVISQERVASLIEERTGAGIGAIRSLVPLRRGPSGRIFLLEVRGTKGSLRVGKELFIRRLLSPTHLKSSAFVVDAEGSFGEPPRSFTFTGAGWGHGVGMCQIGAGVMAARGHSCAEILTHYFPTSSLAQAY